jgi:hypothetical protein
MIHLGQLVHIQAILHLNRILESEESTKSGCPIASIQVVDYDGRQGRGPTASHIHTVGVHVEIGVVGGEIGGGELGPKVLDLVDQVEGCSDGSAAVWPVAGRDHLAVELVVLVDGLEQKVSQHKVHVEVFFSQYHAKSVALHAFAKREPIELAAFRLIRVEAHDHCRVVVPNHLPKLAFGLFGRVLGDDELILTARAVQIRRVYVLGSVAARTFRQNHPAIVDWHDSLRPVFLNVVGRLGKRDLVVFGLVLGDELELAVDQLQTVFVHDPRKTFFVFIFRIIFPVNSLSIAMKISLDFT